MDTQKGIHALASDSVQGNKSKLGEIKYFDTIDR